MRDSAGAGCYALPAINVTSSQTLNAAMCGFAELRGQRALSAAAAASVSVQRSSTTRFESCLRVFAALAWRSIRFLSTSSTALEDLFDRALNDDLTPTHGLKFTARRNGVTRDFPRSCRLGRRSENATCAARWAARGRFGISARYPLACQ
jgi:hypothetical protein